MAEKLTLWMDVMRRLEPVIDNHERLFDAWAAGGVDGLVIGPLVFADGSATFDPDPAVYRAFDTPTPPPALSTSAQRDRFERTLRAARDRGWSVWLFQPGIGAAMPDGAGSIIVDAAARRAWAARIVDALAHYPAVDGGLLDGPEWGYEIAPRHMVRHGQARSHLFDDLPAAAAGCCADLGYDYRALLAARDRLAARLHALTDRDAEMHGAGASGLLGAFGLFGADPHLYAWLGFRLAALTACYTDLAASIRSASRPGVRLAAGPRSAAFAPLCGYDLPRLASILDLLLPKHYFWHRGFDGLYGTLARYVATLVEWNAGLSESAALRIVASLFGLALPGISCLADFDAGFPDAFFAGIVAQETRRVLAAVGAPERVAPWIDAGRRPHEGDPMGAGDLARLLDAAAGAGMRRFIYHHHGNLTAGEWAVITARCGQPWQTVDAPPLTADLRADVRALPGYYPPDEPVL